MILDLPIVPAMTTTLAGAGSEYVGPEKNDGARVVNYDDMSAAAFTFG